MEIYNTGTAKKLFYTSWRNAISHLHLFFPQCLCLNSLFEDKSSYISSPDIILAVKVCKTAVRVMEDNEEPPCVKIPAPEPFSQKSRKYT